MSEVLSAGRTVGLLPRRLREAALVLVALTGTVENARAASVIATIPVGAQPHGVAVNSQTNRVYVANSGGAGPPCPTSGNTVSVINGATNGVLGTVAVGNQPFGVAVNSLTNRIYVSNNCDDTVSVIDGSIGIGAVIATIPIGQSAEPDVDEPEELAINRATAKLYVANWSSGSVSVVNANTNTWVTDIAVGTSPNGVAVNESANRIYVTNFSSNSISVINGASDTVVDTISPVNTPNGIKYDRTTNRLYVTSFGPDQLLVIDATTKVTLATIAVGINPDGVAVSPLGNRVYVGNTGADSFSVVDTALNRVEQTLQDSPAQDQPREGAVNLVTRRAYFANFGSDSVSVLEDPSACCDLGTTETDLAGPPANRRIQIDGAARFRLRFDRLTGGSVDRFYDLAEDAGATLDLGGGDPSWNSYTGLFFDSIWYQSFTSGAPPAWYGWSAGDSLTPDAKLELLEATPTRVKLRQETFYHHSLSQGLAARIPGLKGVGDYSLYGIGRLALKWQRVTSTPVTWGGGAAAVGSADLDWAVHKDPGVPALAGWTAYRPAGALAPNTTGGPGSGGDDFLLMKSDYTATSPNVKTDLLATLYSDWADAQVSAHNDTSAGSDKAAWVAWDDTRTGAAGPHIRNWTTGQSETFRFLTYFKPTNLGSTASPWLDPAVTTRSSDYRGPATISAVGPGTRWEDADEGTSAVDAFNESEAAYLFDAHPTQGLVFTMSASLAQPRYAPFLKIRQWRFLQDPPAVSLGGHRLTNEVDYKADVKPVSRAHWAQRVNFHSTLHDTAAINSNPGIGNPGTVVGIFYPGARYGNGAQISGDTEYFAFSTVDFVRAKGAIEFWYRPAYASTDGAYRDIAGFRTDGANQVVLERQGDNSLRLYFRAGGAESGVQVNAADYHWFSGEWVHVRLEWDDTAPLATQLRILLNGARPPQTPTALSVDYNSAGLALPPDQQFRFGNTDGDLNFSPGIYDELWVFDGDPTPATSPREVAHGGLASAASEYLATAGQNLDLTFTAITGATRQGSYFLIGADSRFRGLNVSLAVPGASVMASGTLHWEYWTALGWSTLEAGTGFIDGTNDFRQSGVVFWTIDPSGWVPYSIGGGPDLYYIRVRLNSGASYSTPPTESVIKTDILLFQYCGDFTSDASLGMTTPVTTEVALQSFGAIPGDASVVLEWRTASELRNLGFHLYRGSSADGPWARLTSSLIPGLGSSAVGQAYSFRDSGLSNGTRYFYRLEDVDASSKTTLHGPVSAVPVASATGVGSGDKAGGKDGPKKTTAQSCPDWVLQAYASAAGADAATASLSCSRHGDPEASSFVVVARDSRSATVELRTGGFYALHESSGRVRVFVPGFDFPQDDQAAALPIRRVLVEAVVGRKVQLGGVRALELQGFDGLVPSAQGKAEMQVGRDGTVRAARRGSRSPVAAFPTSELATLLPSLFQGETKSAAVEIAPLRFDAQRLQLVLAKRVRVRLLFTGREPGESGRGSRGRAPGSSKNALPGQVLARLFTTSRGLHAVPFEQLLPAERRGLSLSELRLERQGEAVAFHVEPASPSFGPGSRLYFFADRIAASTEFTAEVAFELVRSREGVRMPQASARPSDALISSAPVGLASFETNRLYQPGLLEAEDLWLWEPVASGATRVQPFSLSGVVSSGTAELDVILQGASESGNPVDHHVSVSVNGARVGEAQFAGKKPYRISLSLPASLLREGTNDLSLANIADTGVSSLVFLDRFTLAHPQASLLADGRLEGTWPESGTATVSGVSTSLAVLDVTGSGGAGGSRWLTGYEIIGGALRFRVEPGRRYVIVSQEALLSPRVAKPKPSGLRSAGNRADYVLIAPEAFLAAAGPLLERRADQGLATRAVAFEQIAAEFGHGLASAEAIKAFLAHAFHSWARPSPRYVLLLGDSSYDPRNLIGNSQPSPLPALWTKTTYLWTASDPQLAAVNGADSLPDLAIGRLPAATVEQAEALVHKLLAWEDSGQGLAGSAALVADNPDVAGDFEADVQDVAQSFLASRRPELLLLSQLGPELRPRILDALNGGLSFLSYVGHGGAAVWASENVWNSWDAESLQAQSQQPLLVTMNCLNGYFVAPSFDSLSESLLKAEGRGAIASFSPSGLSLDGPAHQYHRALMAELTQGTHPRLGDAILAAQKTYAQTGLMPELLHVYHLLGDPATSIR